jgi:uncharacterized protein (DUF58 family)
MREALSALTTRGRAFLAAGITISLCAFIAGFDALLRVGVLAIALPLLTALLVSRARYRLMASRYVTPTRVSAGQPATVTLALANDGAMPMGLLLLEDQVPYVLGTRARFILDHAGPRWHEEVSYAVRSEVRGRYDIGPLTIRVSDPFGLIELVRSFHNTASLIVVPQVHPLPSIGITGDWTGAGENRPRAFAVGSAEDVTVREYRHGDDLRRVHWRSTAKTGELMVRREEQPWQSRATVLLDSRAVAHRGSGLASSLEWAISAAASIAVHLTQAGFSVRLVTDRHDVEAHPWHDKTTRDAEQSGPILDELAVMTHSTNSSLSEAVDAVADSPGLVIAILGDLTAADIAELSRVSTFGTPVLSILLDTTRWGHATPLAESDRADQVSSALSGNNWCVTTAWPDQSPTAVWQRLGALLTHGPSGASTGAQRFEHWSGSPSTADAAP